MEISIRTFHQLMNMDEDYSPQLLSMFHRTAKNDKQSVNYLATEGDNE
jgi:hypothetical protein